ncbi:ABC transporter-like protein [Thermoclostridium stercorarium subsp. stercorarium DSM 8532]|uniref:ABC transporter-like protein n=1 Tax=Thermoclostridium stercorarium (strain ATCC 35414 / DSM 8532 / NCIMB 11754) TaxID=1121335 RepID=L7VQ75_THES1|nr:ABC transporter ATP-binding protein [Thermoclostridium stercorarium]AGC68576.1 ABC transporter-like protein [Thermoclostridium stercorarium subsp. stercorarium DSM 8532]AGI39592.1 ABC transporter ATPase subunit [Thermoclostridium stercorarium subsp. stercorarium DSM 8532]
MSNKTVLVEMKNICKTFGVIRANIDVNFSVYEGEIHGLLGENGAGKSTLVNMLSGIYKPDSGSIFIHGKEVNIHSPKHAIELGIGMIHQHFKLVDVLTAAENILLGYSKAGYTSKKNKIKSIQDVMASYGMEIDLNKKIKDMSVSEKQTVEILKVLYRGSRILILDEPTAVLTPQETQKLFAILRNLAGTGCAIIIITHKLNEIMEVTDRVTVLRQGKTVATLETSKTNIRELTELMVGKPVNLSIERVNAKRGNLLLSVKGLTALGEHNVPVLDDVTFDLYEGEILGVAGVAGSGQKELCEAIAGLYPVATGDIYFKGENIVGYSPREIIRRGVSMSFIPEDRLGMGLVPSMDMVDNMLLKDYINQPGITINRKPAREKAERVKKRLDIQAPSIFTPIRKLSGGNIQKVLLGREIDASPQLLITAYPVRGLDIGASYTIYELLKEQKRKGVGILYIGEDLDVLIELCDRIMVLCYGKITGIVDAQNVTKEDLGLMMAGVSPAEKEDSVCK